MREATNGLFNVELIAVASVVNTFDIAFVVTFNVGFAVGLAVVIVAFVERGAFLSGGSVVATIQIAVFVAGFVGIAFVFTQQGVGQDVGYYGIGG